MPLAIASASSRPPLTSSHPRSRRAPARSGSRTSATTSSPRPRRIAATFPPMNPVAPVTNARIALRALHRGDHGVGDLRRADRGGVVAGGLHVVRDALPLGDNRGDGALQPVGRLGLVD